MARHGDSKRKIETIDLTSDDAGSSQSQPRKIARSSQTEYSSQPQIQVLDRNLNQREIPDEFEEEQGANDVIVLSQDGGATESFELYGVLSTKIVGIRYYTGYATVGEYVGVRREPQNQYDSNAIRVENVQHDQIGHIPRAVALKLASYMDSGALLVEGSIDGRRGAFDMPIALSLYGTSDPVERANLRNQMKSDRLPVTALDRREKEARDRKKEELKALRASKNGMGMKAGKPSNSQTEYTNLSQNEARDTRSLEDIVQESQRFNPREMGQAVERFGAGEDVLSQMPMAKAPERLATKLLPYQLQGLAWLLEKEDPKVPDAGSKDVVQLWKRSQDQGSKLFTNIATNFSVKGVDPTLASGGILADDMGLGKTIEIIALILSDIQTSETPTLIVAPLGLMSNWSGQIFQHVHSDKPLRVLTYHGNNKKSMSPAEFAEYDVVITTYGSLQSEYYPCGTKTPPSLPTSKGLFSLTWRRVILDEGHSIRNPQTKSSLAASGLLAKSRWVLTGTPIVNSLKDLYSLVRFLRLSGGLERLDIFNSVLIRPLKAGYEEASLLLQALMSEICLRRKKEMKFVDLRLPELSEYVHRIDFLPHEKEKYDALRAEAQGLLQKSQSKHKKDGQETYRHLLEILLRLRQVCNHWKLCGERVTSLLEILGSQKVVDLTPENKQALQEMLQLSIESHEDCPVCLEPLHNPVITACAHSFGFECIERVIETQHRCPMCRAEPLDVENLVRPAAGLGETVEQLDIDADTNSSKIEALLSILRASSKKKGTKVVVFSQWTSFLNIVQKQLDLNGFKYARIDGTMGAPARDASMRALEMDPECTVMLASLAVCSVGLNLVAANQVILADSWWAPAIEDQAVDRVHRLGQTRPTTVFRLVMEGSIEEQVLEIQADKRKLMMTAFQEKSTKRGDAGKNTRLADIEKLLK